MLDKQLFLKGINYLKANYINWGFDLNNDLMIGVWYKKFSNLDANVFMSLVEKYTEVSKFPPNSPADLLELLKDQLERQELSSSEAWQEVIRLIHEYGFNYGREKIFKALDSKPALKKTVEEMESELRYLEVGDTYTPQRFKKLYEVNLKRNIEQSSCVLLGTKSILFIE